MIRKEIICAEIFIVGILGSVLIASCSKDAELHNAWVKITQPDTTHRFEPIGLAIGNKAYLGLGLTADGINDSHLWQFDPQTTAWSRKADFPGERREYAFSCSDDSKLFVGAGRGMNNSLNDVWQYDASADKWSQLPDLPFTHMDIPFSFTISNQLFVNFGTQLWSLDLQQKTWSRKNDLPFTILPFSNGYSPSSRNGTAMIISGEINLVFTEMESLDHPTGKTSLWKYDPSIDTWTVVHSNFSAGGEMLASAIFNISRKIFCSYDFEWWGDYSIDDNPPVLKGAPALPKPATTGACFSVAGKGYVFQDRGQFWQYNP